jgi:hypothetical protein
MKKIILSLSLLGALGLTLSASELELGQSLKVGNYFGNSGISTSSSTKFYEDSKSEVSVKTQIGYNDSVFGSIGGEYKHKIIPGINGLFYTNLQTFKTDITTTETKIVSKDVYDIDGEFVETIDDIKTTSNTDFKRFSGKTIGIGINTLDPFSGIFGTPHFYITGKLGAGVLNSDIKFEKELIVSLPLSKSLSVEFNVSQKTLDKNGINENIETVETGLKYTF